MTQHCKEKIEEVGKGEVITLRAVSVTYIYK